MPKSYNTFKITVVLVVDKQLILSHMYAHSLLVTAVSMTGVSMTSSKKGHPEDFQVPYEDNNNSLTNSLFHLYYIHKLAYLNGLI